MANEISLRFGVTASKGGTTVANATTTKTQSMESALTEMLHSVQNVGTSREAVALGDVPTTSQYIILLRNMDATNFVTVEMEYSSSAYAVCGILLPGEIWQSRLPAYTAGYPKLTVIADTAACDVEVIAVAAGDPAA